MSDGRRWRRDVPMRAAGLVALVVAWLLAVWLYRSFGHGHHHDPSVLELAVAAAGFLCFSAGAALVLAGAGLLDRIEVSQRWARRAP